MKNRNMRKWFLHACKAAVVIVALMACEKSLLTESPTDRFSAGALKDRVGFQNALNAIYDAIRLEQFEADNQERFAMDWATDMTRTAEYGLAAWRDYNIYLTPTASVTQYWWDRAYTQQIPRANLVINALNENELTMTELEKKQVEAAARFFRAYAYNNLVNVYGGVPLITKVTEPQFNITRSTKEQTLNFIREDLEFAAQNLPKKGDAGVLTGQITRAAADHLLTEVYINLKQWDNAIASATKVIGGADGNYSLVKNRFGKYKDSVGTNVYWDLFREGGHTDAANSEVIWAIQFEYNTPGGIPTIGNNLGQRLFRGWGARWFEMADPDNKAGMTTGGPVILAGQLNKYGDNIGDSTVRPPGWMRPTNYFAYQIWSDPNDIRNANCNIRRTWYYNNAASAHFGKPAQMHQYIDTTYHMYPHPTKVDGTTKTTTFNAPVYVDVYKMRMAETYLLRAEAYLGKGDLANAAADINTVRSRANAAPVASGAVNIQYILDERARELYVEEPRRRTLVRLGLLVSRVKQYNSELMGPPNIAPRSGIPGTADSRPDQPGPGVSIKDFHELFPIPQREIAATRGTITQNPGYQ